MAKNFTGKEVFPLYKDNKIIDLEDEKQLAVWVDIQNDLLNRQGDYSKRSLEQHANLNTTLLLMATVLFAMPFEIYSQITSWWVKWFILIPYLILLIASAVVGAIYFLKASKEFERSGGYYSKLYEITSLFVKSSPAGVNTYGEYKSAIGKLNKNKELSPRDVKSELRGLLITQVWLLVVSAVLLFTIAVLC